MGAAAGAPGVAAAAGRGPFATGTAGAGAAGAAGGGAAPAGAALGTAGAGVAAGLAGAAVGGTAAGGTAAGLAGAAVGGTAAGLAGAAVGGHRSRGTAAGLAGAAAGSAGATAGLPSGRPSVLGAGATGGAAGGVGAVASMAGSGVAGWASPSLGRAPSDDDGVVRREVVLHRPQVPVVDRRAGQQDADAAGQRTQHRKPPGPAVNRLERGVKAHGPAPEQRAALAGRAAIDDLADLALAADVTEGQHRRTVHGEEQRRAIQEGNRERGNGL